MDCGRMTALGWNPRIGLREGLKDAYQWYVQHEAVRRGGTLGVQAAGARPCVYKQLLPQRLMVSPLSSPGWGLEALDGQPHEILNC